MKDAQLVFLKRTCSDKGVLTERSGEAYNAILTSFPSISHVSRTDLSTTVRSPFPKGACIAMDLIASASLSLRGKPIVPIRSTSSEGLGAEGYSFLNENEP